MASIVYQTNKKTGVVYVYKSESYWDKDKQQSRAQRKCIGKLDPVTGEVIPTHKPVSEPNTQSKRGPKPTLACNSSFCGATWLFDAIGKQTGVTQDLQHCFPDTWRQILSVAYYLILEDNGSMSRFSKWASIHIHPFGTDIPSQRLSDLFQSITEDARQQFFRLQSMRRVETEYLFYDTTSISSYSQMLRQVKYGYNKEHDPIAQINLALLFGESSMLPVCYRKLPGNISDVKTIRNLLDEIDYLELHKVNLVMDRGFYSESNINELYRKHHKFLIGARLSLKLIKQHLDQARDHIATRKHYSSKYAVYYHSFLSEWNYTETKKRSGEVIKDTRRIYVHLYYNDARASEDRMAFNSMLDMLEYELLNDKHVPEHEKQYAKYFTIKITPVKGISVEANQDAIDEAEKNYGYFALLSNDIKDPLEALKVYRSRDLIEKAFGNLKERLNMRRYYVSSEESLDGKLFVQFVALIFLSYIQKTMHDNDLFRTYTLQGLLDELDIIQRYEFPARKHSFSEITKKQSEIFQIFGVTAPA